MARVDLAKDIAAGLAGWYQLVSAFSFLVNLFLRGGTDAEPDDFVGAILNQRPLTRLLTESPPKG